MEQEKIGTEIQSITTPEFGNAPNGALVPKNFEGMWRMAMAFARSRLMPKGFETPEAIFVAIQMGMEVGLTPMAAVQNIAVINGKPGLYGDGMLAVAKSSGKLELLKESSEGKGEGQTAVCMVKVKGEDPIERRFSIEDAKRAGLWKKAGPWTQYPQRMLQMRARSWALRDVMPDVLLGISSAEELMDTPVEGVVEEIDRTDPKPMTGRINLRKKTAELPFEEVQP